MEFTSVPVRGTVALPPYRAVLAVDMERFSDNSARHQQVIGTAIPEILREAFVRCNMLDVWDDARFPRHGGDGYVMGTPPENLPYLVDPFLTELDAVLREKDPEFARHSRSLRLRLRASIDVGPLPDFGGGNPLDAMGEAMITTHRLLDSTAVKDALRTSDPDATLLAAIISRRVHEDAVLGGFADIEPTRWTPVEADIPEKRFNAEGFLFIPTPSRNPGLPQSDSDQPDGRPHRPEAKAPPESADDSGHTRAGRDANQFGTVQGDVRIGDDNRTSLGDGSIGSIGGNTGSIVLGANGPVNTGGRQDNRQDNRRWHGGDRPGSRRSRDDRGAEPEEDGWDG
ncbi:hypothetical protein [Nocardiopsis coralliicola]